MEHFLTVYFHVRILHFLCKVTIYSGKACLFLAILSKEPRLRSLTYSFCNYKSFCSKALQSCSLFVLID